MVLVGHNLLIFLNLQGQFVLYLYYLLKQAGGHHLIVRAAAVAVFPPGDFLRGAVDRKK